MLLRAIEKVSEGQIWMNYSLLGGVFDRLTDTGRKDTARRDPARERIASLTPRESEIVSTMVNHAGAKQIAVAEKLVMSEHTLRNHLTAIYSKLQVRGRLEMHIFASAHGLDEPKRSSPDY